MTRQEAKDLEHTALIIESILCNHCKHFDYSGRDIEVCSKCCNYSVSKLEFEEEQK